MRKWREIHSLHFHIFSLFPPPLSEIVSFCRKMLKWESSASCDGLTWASVSIACFCFQGILANIGHTIPSVLFWSILKIVVDKITCFHLNAMICFIYGSRDGMGWIGLAMGHRYSKSTFGANKDFFKSFLVDHGQSNNPVKDKIPRVSLRIDIFRSCYLFFRFLILFRLYFFRYRITIGQQNEWERHKEFFSCESLPL